MDLNIGSFPIPVSALNIFDTISILLLVPVFDGFLYPYFKSKGNSYANVLNVIESFAQMCYRNAFNHAYEDWTWSSLCIT